MACKPSCKLCKNLVITQSATIVAVNGVDTLVFDLPERCYLDGSKVCIVIAQTIPAETTIVTPVAFSIGGDTSVVYPFTRFDCSQVTACSIRTRTRYSTCVSTNAVSGVFKSLGGLSCCPVNNLESLPVPATTTPAVASLRTTNTPSKVTKTTTTTKKEVVANE